MRHGKKFNHLGRKSAHRKALLRNLAIALIQHKRITTTLAKAKALRAFIEPLVTKGKSNTMHSRRVVFSYLQNKEAVKELFGPVAAKVGNRPGGYVRVIKTGFRRSDASEMAMIEFVDFNDVYNADSDDQAAGKRKRRRRGGGKKKDEAATAVAETTEEVIEEAEEVVEEVAEQVEETAEAAADVADVAEEAEDVVEDAAEATDGEAEEKEEKKAEE